MSCHRHHVGRLEHRVGGRLVAGLPVEAVVVGLALEVVADDRGVGGQRLPHVDHRREHLVVDLDQLERVARRVAVLGHHEGDLLALEAHLVGGQHGLHVVGQRGHPRQALLGQVGAGDHGHHLGVRLGGADVDAHDAGVGHRRAQDRQVQHPGELDVVAVLAHAAHEARVLLAEHAAVADRLLVVVVEAVERTGVEGGHDAPPTLTGCSVWRAAAYCTDRTMVA